LRPTSNAQADAHRYSLPCLQRAGASMHLLTVYCLVHVACDLPFADACIQRPCLTAACVSTPHVCKHKCISCLCLAKCTGLPSQHAFQQFKFVSTWTLACRYEQMLGSVMLEVKKMRTIQRIGSGMHKAHKDRKCWKYMVSLLAHRQGVHYNPVSIMQDACVCI